MERLICLGIGYIFGMFQTGYLVGKSHHIDIRQCGSGNAGTTNALRTLGKKAGAITLLGDMFKCVLAILLIDHLFKNNYQDISLFIFILKEGREWLLLQGCSLPLTGRYS